MKFILIAAVIATIGIAIIQHSKLSDLNAETTRLEAGKTPSVMKRAARSLPMLEAPREATAEQLELVRETMIEAVVAHRDRTSHLDPQRWKQALLAGKDFSGKDIARLVELLGKDSRLAGMETNEIITLSSMILSETPPVAWREFIEANRDLQDWQNLFDSVVRKCLQADAKRTIDEFVQETALGNPDFASSGIRAAVLMKLAMSDPDKMLAMAASPEFVADPDALAHLGGATASSLDKPADHQHFLAVLRRAQEKNPSSVLVQIRQDYVSGIGRRLYDWPPADAISLIDSGFTPDERFSTAAILARRGDLNEAEKWLDWFLRIDLNEWVAWTQRQGTRDRHPVVAQIESRSIQDSDLPGEWLTKIPPGTLRDEATLSHAWTIADRDPDRAAGYLAELPESDGKQNLVKKIGNAKR